MFADPLARRSRRRAPGISPRRGARLARAALIVTAVVAAGVLGAGGTYALLSAQASTPGVTVTAGSLGLQVDGGTSAGLGTWTVSPETSVARAFTVSNSGNVAADVSAATTSVDDGALADAVRVRLTAVDDSAACVVQAAPMTTVLTALDVAVGVVEAGEGRVLCLEASLEPAAPADLSGTTVGFQLTLTATQNDG